MALPNRSPSSFIEPCGQYVPGTQGLQAPTPTEAIRKTSMVRSGMHWYPAGHRSCAPETIEWVLTRPEGAAMFTWSRPSLRAFSFSSFSRLASMECESSEDGRPSPTLTDFSR